MNSKTPLSYPEQGGRRPALTPRGLRRTEAAHYVGVSTSLFDRMVVDGRMPKPFRVSINGTTRGRVLWDIRQLDDAFDILSGNAEVILNPWDEALA